MTYSGKFQCRASSIVTNTSAPTLNSLVASCNILESSLGQGSNLCCNSTTTTHTVGNSIGMLSLCLLEKTQNLLEIVGTIRYSNHSSSSARVGTQLGSEGINYYSTAMNILNGAPTGVTVIKKSGSASANGGSNTVTAKGFSSVCISLKDV